MEKDRESDTEDVEPGPASHRPSPNEPRNAGHSSGAGRTPDPDTNRDPDEDDAA